MQLDPVQVTLAARELGNAVDHVVAARRVDVPLVFGHRGASREVGRHVRAAVAGARAAQGALASGAGPFEDALAAVETLARGLERTGRRQHELETLTQGDTWSSVYALREQLDTTAALLDLPAGELLSGVRDKRETLMKAARPDWRFLEAIAELRPRDLGVAAPYLRQVRGNYWGETAVGTILRDPAEGHAWAWKHLTTAATERPLRADVLRTAFGDATRELAGSSDARMPAWLRGLPDDAQVIMTEDQAFELELLGRAGRREDVVSQLVEALATTEPRASTIKLALAAGKLDDDLRVVVPLAPDAPVLDQMLDLGSEAVSTGHHRFLRDAYVRLATSSDDVLRREMTRLAAMVPSSDRPHEQLARLGVERPELLLGPTGASSDWATPYLSAALGGYTPSSMAAGARPAAYEFLRRTDADRALVFNEYRRLADAPDLRQLPTDLEAVAVALTAMPSELRPRGTDAIQPLLASMFPAHRNASSARPTLEQAERGRDALRLVLEAEQVATDPGTTRAAVRAELDELLARPLADVDDATIRRVALLTALPRDVRPAVPGELELLRRWAGVDHGSALESIDRMRVLRDAEGLVDVPGTTRQSTTAELRRLLDMPDGDRTHGDVRRILTLLYAPADVSPIVGPTLDLSRLGLERAARIGEPNVDRAAAANLTQHAVAELEHLHLAVDRSELFLHGATPSAVRAELRSLLADETAELDATAIRRIAILDGLPEAVRGYARIPGTPGIAAAWKPGSDGSIHRTSLGVLRLTLDAADDAASSAPTREGLTAELAQLLSRSNDQLTGPQRRRMALIASMPDDVRPDLSALTSKQPLPVIHVQDLYLAGDGRSSLDAARAAILPGAGLTIDELVAMVRQSDGTVRLEGLAPAARPTITGASDAELTRLGIRPTSLLRDVLENTRDSGDRARVTSAVRMAHPLALRLEVATPGEQHVLDRLRATLQRNLDRADGVRKDGYSTHPDYAEHGRAIEDAVLLGRIDDLRHSRASTAPQEAAASASDAATGAEVLSW